MSFFGQQPSTLESQYSIRKVFLSASEKAEPGKNAHYARNQIQNFEEKREGEDTTDQVAGSYPLRLAFLTFLSPSRPTNRHILNHMLVFLIPSLHSHILMSFMQSIMAEDKTKRRPFP